MQRLKKKKKKKKCKVSGLTSDLLNQKAWVWGPASVLSRALQGFLMHATTIELLPVRRGKLMLRGEAAKVWKHEQLLMPPVCKVAAHCCWVPIPKVLSHAHTHSHIYEHLA